MESLRPSLGLGPNVVITTEMKSVASAVMRDKSDLIQQRTITNGDDERLCSLPESLHYDPRPPHFV